MEAEIALRAATPEDAPALAALSTESSGYYARLAPELFAEAETDGFAEWIAAEWDDGPDTLALVVEIEGAVVGYLEATVQEPETWRRFFGARDFRERRLFVNALLTAAAYRRRGVATMLVEAAEDWGRQRGAGWRCSTRGSTARSRFRSGRGACATSDARSCSARCSD